MLINGSIDSLISSIYIPHKRVILTIGFIYRVFWIIASYLVGIKGGNRGGIRFDMNHCIEDIRIMDRIGSCSCMSGIVEAIADE